MGVRDIGSGQGICGEAVEENRGESVRRDGEPAGELVVAARDVEKSRAGSGCGEEGDPGRELRKDRRVAQVENETSVSVRRVRSGQSRTDLVGVIADQKRARREVWLFAEANFGWVEDGGAEVGPGIVRDPALPGAQVNPIAGVAFASE